uniref:TIL domain-containing protein n=1 Tax=Pseudictyota dubia TaxID=2749911 RepID=A0A7R9ZD63_9STRA|mmetsp:Transcript_41749/g.77235  ORF Transcript_41749/g.77235 Transcript_41749/m.77235 type:complete len:178 (+) Transcript_41749:151-684(+)
MKLAVAAIVIFSTSATLVSGHSGGLRQMMQTCPLNEVYKTCASSCPETCDNYGQPIRCNKRCAPAGCFCEEGYVREDDTPGSACILPTNCPLTTCAANEVYQTCGTACPATCSTKDAIRPCIAMCVQGCFCEDGYVRDDDTDACVRSEDCPAEQTTTTTTTTTMATTTTTTSSTGSD